MADTICVTHSNLNIVFIHQLVDTWDTQLDGQTDEWDAISH